LTASRECCFEHSEEISRQNAESIGPMPYAVEQSVQGWFASPTSLAITEIDNLPSAVPSEMTSELGLESRRECVRKGLLNEVETAPEGPPPATKSKRVALKT
jgi:hypothetical protein